MTVKETRRKPLPLTKALLDITVGVHASEASGTHSEGVSVGDIATWHEFGTQTVPMRSFVRAWYDENPEFIRATLKRELTAAAQGKRTVDQALERAALRFEASVKARIRAHIPPPLKPATIARKGSSTPLVDRGILLNAIRGRVSLKSGG